MTNAPEPESTAQAGHGFGTSPVSLASISTILGAILFLRFGYAVGHVGFIGTLLIIVLGHLVTVPSALAIAEIATKAGMSISSSLGRSARRSAAPSASRSSCRRPCRSRST